MIRVGPRRTEESLAEPPAHEAIVKTSARSGAVGTRAAGVVEATWAGCSTLAGGFHARQPTTNGMYRSS